MANNKQTWVSPNKGSGWKIHHPEAQRATRIFETKQEAIDFGRQVSQNQKTEFIVQNMNGLIGFKDSHGNDSPKTKG